MLKEELVFRFYRINSQLLILCSLAIQGVLACEGGHCSMNWWQWVLIGFAIFISIVVGRHVYWKYYGKKRRVNAARQPCRFKGNTCSTVAGARNESKSTQQFQQTSSCGVWNTSCQLGANPQHTGPSSSVPNLRSEPVHSVFHSGIVPEPPRYEPPTHVTYPTVQVQPPNTTTTTGQHVPLQPPPSYDSVFNSNPTNNNNY